jgi:DNA-binding response OmpR family regulator
MTTILVVTDDNAMRKFLRTIMAGRYLVVEALVGTQTLALARRVQPDVVLLDIDFQGYYKGLTMCRALRSDTDPILAQVPILMLTGYTSGADITAALASGANAYVHEPYHPEAILTLIGALLAKKDQSSDNFCYKGSSTRDE